MTSPWNDPAFVKAWNDTYGIDMRESPIRRQLAFPLIERHMRGFEGKTLADFGCGNGSLIGHFIERPFAAWTGYDSGAAILESAAAHIADPRVAFRRMDVTSPGLVFEKVDALTSVFVLEEIPDAKLHDYFTNVARALKKDGAAFIFTQHPAYAMIEARAAHERGEENLKFRGHKGYFDRSASTYALRLLNQRDGEPVMAAFHHHPMHRIFNSAGPAGLFLDAMVETPAGAAYLLDVDRHRPSPGDYPRFLFLKFVPR